MPRVIHLDTGDNVAVAAEPLEPGAAVDVAGRTVAVRDAIPTGGKVAVGPVAPGEKVVKFGAPIGSATRRIAPGEYVHLHNLSSDYLPTYTLQQGQCYTDTIAPGSGASAAGDSHGN